MMDQQTIERIDAVPIEGIVEHFGRVELQGNKCRCPFHQERTPSFHIHPGTNTWRCFGCGRGGGSAQFLMAQGHTWLEAMRAIAEYAGIDLPAQVPLTPQQEARMQRRNAQYAAAALVESLCIQALRAPQSEGARAAAAYCAARFGDPGQEGTPAHTFGLGYWPGDLDARLAAMGLSAETLQTAGFMDAQSARRGGLLAGRLIFPIRDGSGRPVGFAGRYLGQGNAPKYVNTRSSDIYQRRALLFGYHQARQAARQSEHLWLVEGYADLLRLHALGASDAVAVMGTQLTDEQVESIRRLTPRVTLLPDTDAAGQAAALAWGWSLLGRGVHVVVASLPPGPDGSKADADSALGSAADLERLPRREFATYAAEAEWQELPASDTYGRARFAQRMVSALRGFDESYAQLAARDLDALDGGHYWRDALRRRPAEAQPAAAAGQTPKPDEAFLKRYGFTVIGGEMHAPDRSGRRLQRVSNFTVEPLYYIRGADGQSHTRLVRLVNTDGLDRVVAFRSVSDGLFSALKFRARVGQEGNFTYQGGEPAFAGLLEYIHQGCKPCQSLARLGWDETHGFWVWANGIYRGGAFHAFGATGVAQVGESYYHFDPSISGGAGVTRFVHREASRLVGLSEWIRRMHRVFGSPGVVAVLYVVATINRDVVSRYGPLPLLNACGPRGTGKSMLANSVMRLFFDGFTLPNLPSSTLASLTATLSSYAHVPIGLDEYSNAIGTPKIELLKSLYDGGGRLKMGEHGQAVMSEVQCGVFMCGQHVAESDVALFSRLIYMDFQRTHYTRDDEEALRELQTLERGGLTHLVHALVDQRAAFAARFEKAYEEARPQMDAILRAQAMEGVISRTVHIWSVLLGTFIATEGLIAWPFQAPEVVGMLQELINAQRPEMSGSDDVANFWSVFLYLCGTGVLREDVDFRVEERSWVVSDYMGNRHTFGEPTRLLLVDMNTAVGRYCEHGARLHGDNILNPLTMRNYLRKSLGYVSCYHKSRLCINDGRGGLVMEAHGGEFRPKRKVKSCYAFRLDVLPVDMQHLSADSSGLSPAQPADRAESVVELLYTDEEIAPFDYRAGG